jgi:hypothetical protein
MVSAPVFIVYVNTKGALSYADLTVFRILAEAASAVTAASAAEQQQ